jgi:hypothetical protein
MTGSIGIAAAIKVGFRNDPQKDKNIQLGRLPGVVTRVMVKAKPGR